MNMRQLLGTLAIGSLLFSLGCDMLRPQGTAAKKGQKPTVTETEDTEPEEEEDTTSSSSRNNGQPGSTGSTTPPGTNMPGVDAGSGASTIPTNPNGLQFARDIRPITERYCTECHHPGGRAIDLTQFPFVVGSMADQGVAADRVIASMGGSMPPAPRDRVPAEAIEKLRKWKSDGMQP